MVIVNIAAYKFTALDSAVLPVLQASLRQRTKSLDIKGTILLSTEGLNLFLAGAAESIGKFKDFIQQIPDFSDLHFKQTLSQIVPFKRLFVKIKKEIITFGVESVKPHIKSAPYISPQQFKKWYQEAKDFIVLDTRNNYETKMGSFAKSIKLNIESFKDFAEAIETLPQEYKEKSIVTYCTAGIRCEKAAAYMLQQGFKEVYQLQGGILHYFEQCGAENYQGDCFVFDERIACEAPKEGDKS